MTACGQASADDAENLRRLLGSFDERQHVQDTAGQSSVVVQNPPCRDVDVHILPGIVVYAPLKFDASGALTQGAWKQAVSAKGCGSDRVLNVFLSKQPGSGSLELRPMLPGTTRADYRLQLDARPFVLTALGEREKNCSTGYIEDTRFLGFKDRAKDGPWDEAWTHVSCTKRAQVIMHFIPDSTGTVIATSLSETEFSPVNGGK